MRNIIISLTLVLGLSSCSTEAIKLKGEFKNFTNSDSYMVVKIKSRTLLKEQILDTIDLSDGKFEFYSKAIKPPVKLTFMFPDSAEFEVWVGEYGTKTLEVKNESLFNVKVVGSFFCDELQRMNKNLYKMYIDPIKEKEVEVARLEKLANLEELSEEDDMSLYSLKKDIKMAYRLRKKSILKTVRKHAQNPVAVALMCQEYDRLTSHQKKECLKYLNRTFSDTGLNWQMKN
ncbi:DUF4369 domain-containing protein [Ancylomarina sp. DW003]|nr:DUF4369 domain-containing protein [Ancylomarina sp. DW003]MDE5423894.1 DUF4369 domain-containing protein [Ancylomarina sp. DW003]